MKKSTTSSIRFIANQAINTSHSVKSLTLVAALATISWAGNVHALGLGHLRVQSALGQPLRAEVELTNAQAASLKANMANPAVYSQRGLQYSPVVKNIRSSIRKKSNGRSVLVLTSSAPINEPFLDIVVQASDRTGKVTRDFSILLDPPAYIKAPAPIVQPVAPKVPAQTTVAQRKVLTLPTIEPESAVETEPAKKRRVSKKQVRRVARARMGKVRVHRGFTASQIAVANRPVGVSLDQMLIALVQANPHAFIKGNVNLMHSGVVLRVPNKQEAQAVSAQEARQIVMAHSNDFNNYRGRLASIPVAQLAPSTQYSAGKVQTQVEDRKVASTSVPDKLTISKSKPKDKQVVAETTEKRVAEALQKKENTSRAEELNRNLEDLKDISASAEAAKKASTKKETPTATPEIEAKLPTVVDNKTDKQQANEAMDAKEVDGENKMDSDVAPTAIKDGVENSDNIVAADAKKSEKIAKPKSEPKPKKKVVSPPREEPGFFEGLMENPLMLGGAAVAILAGLWLVMRRRKQTPEPDDAASSFLESGLNPDSFFHASGGKDVDTSESTSSGQTTNLNQSSMLYSPSQLDAETDVDPVSEADVYLAYGRDIQAEEILKDALLKQPDRIPVHVKLLEIYARRRDVKAYAESAADLKRLTNGEGADWDSIRTRGLEIDPNNSLYGTSNKSVTKTSETVGMASSPEVEPSSVLISNPDIPSDLTPSTASAAEKEKNSEPLDLSLSVSDSAVDVPEFNETVQTNQVDFDMSGLSLDVEDGTNTPSADNPMVTKLALAREFLDIGDRDGARAMAQEVVQHADGELKTQAQSLLDELS